VDEHQHVQPLEEHGIHAEEVGRHQGLSMGSQELPPGQLGSSTGGRHMGAPQDRANRGRGDRAAELEKLASNPEVAPARVLLRHPDDQLPAFLRERRPTSAWAIAISRPALPHEIAVPAEDGLRLNPQSRPGRPWQSLLERRQHHSISRGPLDPLDLTLEHLDLPAKHQHLSLELSLVPPTRGDRVEKQAHERVERSENHGDRWYRLLLRSTGLRPSARSELDGLSAPNRPNNVRVHMFMV
jgi:hypothetical protein